MLILIYSSVRLSWQCDCISTSSFKTETVNRKVQTKKQFAWLRTWIFILKLGCFWQIPAFFICYICWIMPDWQRGNPFFLVFHIWILSTGEEIRKRNPSFESLEELQVLRERCFGDLEGKPLKTMLEAIKVSFFILFYMIHLHQ